VSKFIKPGDVFGLLTVVEETDERDGHCVVWRCMCACGNEVFTHTGRLRGANKTHCGCTTKARLTGRKLTRGLVETIRIRWARGEKQKRLARDYGVSISTISNIVNGRSHKP
jgi:hypothetical protein